MITPTGLDQYDTTPTDDPTSFADPVKQQKLAENILNQLGLHPNQVGAKSLLDAHFSGPTADPEIKKATAGALVNTEGMPAAGATPPAESAEPGLPAKEPAAPTGGGMTSTAKIPNIPTPGNPDSQLIINNADKGTETAQRELKRLIDTGSGISQIHNPFLRGLAHVGEVAGGAFVPNLLKDIPGTEQHHGLLIRQQEGLINANEGVKKDEATVNRTNEETQTQADTVNELKEWIKENPGVPISEYWKQKNSFSKLTPEQEMMAYLTKPIADGGLELDPDVAFKRMKGIEADAKPQTAAQATATFQGLISKMSGGQPFDPKLMSDSPALVKAIGQSKNLNADEKQSAFAYLISHNTPASSAYAANTRAQTMKGMRLFPGINSQGMPVFVTPEMVQENPTEYMPGTLGEHATSKNAAFADIDFNMKNVNDALRGLKDGFSNAARAQMALVLRSSDPHSAVTNFMNSEIGGGLTPDQIDYVTALASLSENALALRSIQGLGQGSDELRAAITKMIPGPGTPNEDFAARQMELLKGTVDRARQGILKTNIKQPEAPPAKTTEELHNENQPKEEPKTVSRAAVEAEVKNLNDINKGNPSWKTLTVEDAIEDAKKHNITVK